MQFSAGRCVPTSKIGVRDKLRAALSIQRHIQLNTDEAFAVGVTGTAYDLGCTASSQSLGLLSCQCVISTSGHLASALAEVKPFAERIVAFWLHVLDSTPLKRQCSAYNISSFVSPCSPTLFFIWKDPEPGAIRRKPTRDVSCRSGKAAFFKASGLVCFADQAAVLNGQEQNSQTTLHCRATAPPPRRWFATHIIRGLHLDRVPAY